MDKELGDIKKGTIRKIANIFKKNIVISIRMFDALVPVSSCGHSGCNCEPDFSSPNVTELQTLVSRLIEKYGRAKFKFELLNVLDPAVKKFDKVYALFKERKEGGLPIISINNKIKFFGRVPSFEEVESEIQAVM